MSGLYIHIPFCRQACSYCDFFFVTKEDLRSEFVDRLCEEIESYRNFEYLSETVRTIYFGGGTPSRLSADQLERIMASLDSVFKLAAEEVTIELNPEDVTPGYLKKLRKIGFNRASMGVQTFDAARLTFMNRAHSPEQAEAALEALSGAGFHVFTVDLIYANPGQTLEELDADLEKLLSFDPPHVSAYSLTVEPKTRLGKEVERGIVTPADDDQQALHFDRVGELLANGGLQRYEVSNYSKPGCEAVHNRHYWKHENYLGLGPSAHSFWREGTTGRRWRVLPDIRRYLAGALQESLRKDEEVLSPLDLAEERLMLGLRTREGVDPSELQNSYSYHLSEKQAEWLENMDRDGYLTMDQGPVQLTKSGIKIVDYLVTQLLSRY